jgi:transposase
MVEAMVYVLRTGIPWRDLPERFGKWSGVYCRWRRWTASGLWDRLLSAVARGARGTTRFVDSTHVKLHQDGANPAGGQGEQAIGRTKGGLNSKLTAVVDCYGRAVALSLHPGPRNDVRTMDEHACLLRGRTLVADKGFDADGLRKRIAHFGGRTCIPRRQNCGGTRPVVDRVFPIREGLNDRRAARRLPHG